MSGSYFLYGSILEKCGKLWKNGPFSGRIWPDWGNAARADLAGLGSIGLRTRSLFPMLICKLPQISSACYALDLHQIEGGGQHNLTL